MATRRAPVFQWRLRLARHVAAPAASGDDEMDPQPRNTFNVAVIGARLSGLCLAQSLKKSGIDVHVYERHGSRGDGSRGDWHARGCNGSGRRGRGRLAGPAVAPAECSAGLARVQCDLWKDESQHNRSSTSSWEARDEWCPGDWIARQDVLFHDDGIPGAAP